MSKLNFLKKIIINIIVSIYSYAISINLYILNKNKNKFYYNNSLGFGDTFIFYLKNYNKIIKNNYYALSFGTLTLKSIFFFFPNKKIKKIFISIPEKIYYRVVQKLNKNVNFKPKIPASFSREYQFNNSIYFKNLIIKLLKKFKLRKKIMDFSNNKYVCLFIKHYNTDTNNLTGSCSRQTSDLKPIKKVLVYLMKKKIITLIFGTNADKSVYILKTFTMKNKLNDYIVFLKDLSPNYLLEDQIYLANNSIGYIGSSSGPSSLFYFLRKKMLLLNCPADPEIFYNKNKTKEKKFIRYMFKYTIGKKNKYIKVKSFIDYKTSIYETSFQEIKKKLNSFLIK